MILPLPQHLNPVLRAKNDEIHKIHDPEFQRFIDDCAETMIDAHGIGIAAPQVARNIRLFLVNMKEGPTAFLNPKILKTSWRNFAAEEGCLSVKGTFGIVKRPRWVMLRYVDRNGKEHVERAEGLLARVFQHEMDHLHGTLFIDKAKKLTQKD